MQLKELVPELHDALKLTVLEHDVSEWNEQEVETFKDFLPIDTETWKGITQHHLGFKIYPTEPDTFYLCVADSLASHVTRIGQPGSVEYRLNKPWRGPEEEKDPRLKETEDIIRLFSFLQTDPEWAEFCREYEDLLRTRSEDLRQGLNVTSLYTHCKLTGQFYRILRNPLLFPVSPTEIEGKTGEEVKALYGRNYFEKWQLVVSRCRFRFLQKPYRVRDLNVFAALEELMKEVSTSYADNVLLGTSNELLLVLSDEGQLSNIVAVAHRRGFWVEVIKARRPLKELKPNPEGMIGKTLENLYDLPPQIPPPICEICQSAKADKYWPEDYLLSRLGLCPSCQQLLSQNPLASVIDLLCEIDKAKMEEILKEPTREELCERCFALRAEGTRLHKLDTWGKEAQNKVTWVKIKLDFDRLQETLESLSGGEVSFSVVAEFQQDYYRFLEQFTGQIQRTFRHRNVESILTDFFCIRVDSFRQAFGVLQVYYELLRVFFPAFLGLEKSPLRISMVCAGAKFPFFEVWNILEDGPDDVFVSLQGTRTIRAPIGGLELLVRAASLRYPKSALHKLTRIEETSETLAELTFQDRRDKDRSTYSKLASGLRPSLGFSSIFTFARLMED